MLRSLSLSVTILAAAGGTAFAGVVHVERVSVSSQGSDVPLPGDYLGLGRAQLAVYRPSIQTWFLRGDDGAALRIAWGGPGDQPVRARYGFHDQVPPSAIF